MLLASCPKYGQDGMLRREDNVGASSLGESALHVVDLLYLVVERIHPAGISATAGSSIAAIQWEHPLGFVCLWLTIYGDGHTTG